MRKNGPLRVRLSDEAEPEIRREMVKCRLNYVRYQTVRVVVSALKLDIL